MDEHCSYSLTGELVELVLGLDMAFEDGAADLAAAAVVDLAVSAAGTADLANLGFPDSVACTSFAGLLGGGLAAAASSVVGWR